jgi:hypothetical protein
MKLSYLTHPHTHPCKEYNTSPTRNTFEGEEKKIHLILKMRRNKFHIPILPNNISMPNINIK